MKRAMMEYLKALLEFLGLINRAQKEKAKADKAAVDKQLEQLENLEK